MQQQWSVSYDRAVPVCPPFPVDDCPLLQAYEQLSNPPKPFTDTDTEYGLKVILL